MTWPPLRDKISAMLNEDNRRDDSPTTMFGWLPEIAGAVLAVALPALLAFFADGIL